MRHTITAVRSILKYASIDYFVGTDDRWLGKCSTWETFIEIHGKYGIESVSGIIRKNFALIEESKL